jgi:hypothetical protein
MNQHVETQQRHDVSSVDLGRWKVSDRRNIDDPLKYSGTAQ